MLKKIKGFIKKLILYCTELTVFNRKNNELLSRDIEVIDSIKKMPIDILAKGNTVKMSALKIVIGYDRLETLHRHTRQGILDLRERKEVSIKPTGRTEGELYFSDFLGTINTNNNLKKYLETFQLDCIDFITEYSKLSNKIDPSLAEQKIIKNYQGVYLQIGSLADQLAYLKFK